jgi:inner membrane protein involved in colicin E2 resistance
MILRLGAILFIYCGATVAWLILGATIQHRSSVTDEKLRGRVSTTWGTMHTQRAPQATFTVPRKVEVNTVENGKTVRRIDTVVDYFSLPLEASDIQADIALEHRRKGLRWFSTYKVGFAGVYRFVNSGQKEVEASIVLPYPAEQAVFDDTQVSLDGAPVAFESGAAGAKVIRKLKPGEPVTVRWAYRSQGLGRWNYSFGDAQQVSQVKDFRLRMKTDFEAIDFADNTLSPTLKRRAGQGWDLGWSYRNLVSGFQIAMVMPEKLQPGPLAGEISYFAPVSLFFFFFVMLVITTLEEIDLHPVNYFFLAAAFFAFHLLLAYLADLIDIHVAFAVSSLVSVFLVVSYLRLVVGIRFAAVKAGGAQFLYLVLFSYAFFFEGLTGLAITIGSILTLFAVMQLTGRVKWSERLSGAGRSGGNVAA